LRSTRERRGITVEQVAQDTRISLRFIEALEEEQFDELPAPVYVRGFLRSYANYLKLDPQPLLDQLVGGDRLPAGSPDGFVRGPGIGFGTHGNAARRPDPFQRSDPFQRPVPPPVPAFPVRASEEDEDEQQGWAPEGLQRSDHVAAAYIPGSDLIEAPEYPRRDEPVPVYRRPAGVLVERQPAAGGGSNGRVVMAAVVAVLAVFAVGALAMFALGGGDGSANQAGGGGEQTPTPGISPTSVVAVGGESPTPDGEATPTPSPDPDATETVEATTTPGTPAPTATPGGPAPTATPTPTPTLSPTPLPTATPTLAPPTATPTLAPPPHPAGLGACNLNLPSERCGTSPARVICYPPFPADQGTGTNSNWFVDVSGNYPLQPGWRERWVPYAASLGPLIEAGQYGCP
jgi:hypothetical protein